MSREIKYSWNLLDNFKTYISEHYLSEKYDCIVCIARGGMIPGVVSAHVLNIPLYVIKASRYNDRDRGEIEVEQISSDILKLRNNKILLVDDIFDEGITMTLMYNILKSKLHESNTIGKCIVIVSKRIRSELPSYVDTLEYISQDTWAIFPWEEK